MTVTERLLKYVKVYTTSKEDAGVIPSTERQFDLAKMLRDELTGLGCADVLLDENCYVYARVPATAGCEQVPAIGLIAHMDTAPDFSGENVKPQVIENYDGKDVVLEGTGDVLKVSDFPELKSFVGRTLITTDGTTLLGADDKAGVAEIMTAVQDIIAEKTPHGDIWIGFTPDEEVGCGADKFNLDYFKADYAYTFDGDYEGEVAYENFNAASATVEITGVNVHPGSAKDIMKNAAVIACEFQNMLPANERPEHTSGREGFYMLHNMEGDNTSAKLYYILRDHDAKRFEEKKNYMDSVTKLLNQKYGEGVVKLTVKESYRNMLEVIEKNQFVVDRAHEAIKSVGLEPISRPVRGGTDGARLSFMGLPCPNMGTGGYGFHGPFEHITVEGMETAVKIAKKLVSL